MSEKSLGGEYSEGESEEMKQGKALKRIDASHCLTCVGPTFSNGNGEKTFAYPAFAYIAMDVSGRNITDISVIPEFTHVIYLDLTNNRLTDVSLKPLKKMKQLRALILDKNFIETAASVHELHELQSLSLRENFLTTCEVRELQNLLYLDLSNNPISYIMPNLWCPYLLPRLTELSLRGNNLKTLEGFLFSSLVSLFLASNNIKRIKGLELLTNLKFLHLRQNPLNNLNGFSSENKKLFYINIRDCQIQSMDELRKLQSLPSLERIVVTGNPFWKGKDMRPKLLAILPRLRRINKEIINEIERQDAEELGSEKEEEIANHESAMSAGFPESKKRTN